MLKEKILAQLVAKYAGVSKKALGLIADKLAKKVTAEDGIEQAITDFDNAVSITEFAADLQREGDSRVGEAKKEWEKKNPPKNDPPKPDDPKNDPPKDDVPAWAKGLMDKVDSLARERSQGTIQSKAKDLLKEVPESFWKGRTLPEKEDDLQTWVESVTKDYNDFRQNLIDQGMMSATPPAGGGPPRTGSAAEAEKKAAEEAVKVWAKEGKKPETASVKT